MRQSPTPAGEKARKYRRIDVHDVDKGDAVVSGRMVVAGHLRGARSGDWVEVPLGIRHSATVVGDEAVVSLDAVKLI